MGPRMLLTLSVVCVASLDDAEDFSFRLSTTFESCNVTIPRVGPTVWLWRQTLCK